MATTTNFGWETPDDTDLVKDGAAAMRTLGNSIDTSFVDLKGGTTGQVLSKASNTDLDYTWVTSDDANAIQNAIVDAKGDLIAASANDTPARLAVGANGETLVADSSTTTGLRYQATQSAGKNAIINGDFLINQRAFTSNTANNAYNFDRWLQQNNGGTYTITPQTFTPGAAPIATYEGRRYLQAITALQTSAGHYAMVTQRIEDVTRYAGTTVTISFFAKADTGTPKIGVELFQDYGTGGSPSAAGTVAQSSVTLTTSWARYSVTLAVPSLSGKTLGTTANTSFLELNLWQSAGSTFNTRASSIGLQNFTASIWGVQLEYSSVATYFTTATGTLQGELAACQRYYYRITGTNTFSNICPAYTDATNNAVTTMTLPVELRVAPTSVDFSNIRVTNFSGAAAVTSASVSSVFNGKNNTGINLGVAGTPLTAFAPYVISCNNNAAGYLGVSAEL